MWSSTLRKNWKQRFFVPTEEEQGIAILATLLEQFSVIATEDEETKGYEPELALLSANTMAPIDLASWIIETTQPHHINDDEQQQIALTKSESDLTTDKSEPTPSDPSQVESLPIGRLASAAAMLQTLPPDCRAPAIQIGFNFAESES